MKIGLEQEIFRVSSATAKKFTQIIYVPNHLDTPEQIADLNNWHYPNGIQQGFITEARANGAFCRYWAYQDIYKPGLKLPPELRTKANGEMTSYENLYMFQTFAPGVVEEAYREVTEGG